MLHISEGSNAIQNLDPVLNRIDAVAIVNFRTTATVVSAATVNLTNLAKTSNTDMRFIFRRRANMPACESQNWQLLEVRCK